MDLERLFDAARTKGTPVCTAGDARRQRLSLPAGEALLDSFAHADCRCLFLRTSEFAEAEFSLTGDYRVATAAAGGWLILARQDAWPSYWIPCAPTSRALDERSRILRDTPCTIRSFESGIDGVKIALTPPREDSLDLVVWQFGPRDTSLRADLDNLADAEKQPVFLWGSHNIYRVPSDLYRHLIHGSIFDPRFAWPHKRQTYSENEAHALHLTLRNRELQSGKFLYHHLRAQVLLSVLARQDGDGGWRHGIWTADMECHFRLHCSAMHMLMDCYTERPDENILAALERAAAFIADQSVEVMGETWFLHDSLEQNEADIRRNIPGWLPCANPIKSPGNTLVLNTHIDTLIALDRFDSISDNKRFEERVSSARRLLRRLLEARPARWRYRMLMRSLYLTLLPTERARALSLPTRALKRLARERFVPLLSRLKCRAPRFVMPRGYLDRALGMRGFPDPYHSINFMDLVRFLRAFPGDGEMVDEPIDGAIAFAQEYDLLRQWAEHPAKRYAIGFWVEGLYQLCLLRDEFELRRLLAESAIFAERNGLGLPPSIAGNNLEHIPLQFQHPCPVPPDQRLRVINLNRAGRRECLVINPGEQEVIPDEWGPPWRKFAWTASDGRQAATGTAAAQIAADGWVLFKASATRDAPE